MSGIWKDTCFNKLLSEFANLWERMGYFNEKLIPVISKFQEKFSDHDLSSIITPLQDECTLENLPNVFLRLLQLIEFLLDRTQSPLKCQL